MQLEQFETEHVYYQWLKRRSRQHTKPPIVLNYMYWALAPAFGWFIFCLAAGVHWVNSLNSSFEWYLIFLPFTEAIIVLAVDAPHYAQEDTSNGLMQSLFTADVTTSEIVSDLRKWILENFVSRPISLVRNMILAVLVLIVIVAAHFPFNIVIIAGIWVLYRFLLGAGLVGAILPRQVVATGILIGWAILIPALAVFGEIVIIHVSWNPATEAIVILRWIMSVVIIAVLYAIGEIEQRIAPRILELRRQGVWE